MMKWMMRAPTSTCCWLQQHERVHVYTCTYCGNNNDDDDDDDEDDNDADTV
jgi:hypothetical protein